MSGRPSKDQTCQTSSVPQQRAPGFGPELLSGLKGLAAVWTDGKDTHVEANAGQVRSQEAHPRWSSGSGWGRREGKVTAWPGPGASRRVPGPGAARRSELN